MMVMWRRSTTTMLVTATNPNRQTQIVSSGDIATKFHPSFIFVQ
jgi:hypothetical protein